MPGNWDYTYGPEVFRKRMSELNHPMKMARIVADVRRPYEAQLKKPVGRTETALFRKGGFESTTDNVIVDAYVLGWVSRKASALCG